MTLDDAITRGQQALLRLLRDVCVITHTPLLSDGVGGWTLGTPTNVTTVANVQRTLGTKEAHLAARLGVVSPAIVRLPALAVVAAGDTLVIGGQTFVVAAPLDTTIALTLAVLCAERGSATEQGSLLRLAAHTSVLAPNPLVYRTAPGDPSTAAATANIGAHVLWVVSNRGSREQQSAAGVGIYASDWLIVGYATVAIYAGDVVSDGARAFIVTGEGATDSGVLIAPAKPVAVPHHGIIASYQAGLRIGAW